MEQGRRLQEEWLSYGWDRELASDVNRPKDSWRMHCVSIVPFCINVLILFLTSLFKHEYLYFYLSEGCIYFSISALFLHCYDVVITLLLHWCTDGKSHSICISTVFCKFLWYQYFTIYFSDHFLLSLLKSFTQISCFLLLTFSNQAFYFRFNLYLVAWSILSAGDEGEGRQV